MQQQQLAEKLGGKLETVGKVVSDIKKIYRACSSALNTEMEPCAQLLLWLVLRYTL
jgi:hypothetical protein